MDIPYNPSCRLIFHHIFFFRNVEKLASEGREKLAIPVSDPQQSYKYIVYIQFTQGENLAFIGPS